MTHRDDIRTAEQPGLEAQRRWIATAALLVVLTVLAIAAPRLAG